MPGGAGTPGGYDGGSGSGSSADGTGAAYQDRIQQIAAAQNRAAAASRAAARENAIQLAALTPKTIEPIRHHSADTPTQIAEQKEIDLYGYQDAKAKAPTTLIPKTVTYDKGNPFTDRLIPTTVGQTLFDPRTSQNALLKRPGGIGTTLKNIALGVLAPQLLAGTKLAPLYRGYRTYQTAKRFIPEGVRETIQTAFTPRLTTEKEYTRNLVKKPSQYRDRDEVKTAAEQVATGEGLESGTKLLGLNDAQQNYIRKIIAGKDQRELQMIAGKAKISIDSGKASQIEKDVFQMIQEYLV
jgi:hypothetical protein|tara:strand:- start:42 stop:932 length:891 start_codon:yes stop_codon:yes gene_type:complete